MIQTQLNIINRIINLYISQIFQNKINELSFSIFNILFGFFLATALATIPGQTGDWGIIGAAIIVTCYEIISLIIYPHFLKYKNILLVQINSIKIGIIYGFFVDAFKLGS
uniref:Uncharacterized protein ycf20 n=1 Tax=Lympha mucosa TaxID=2045360 RepID=A0A6B9VS31_9FLOR|nr:hypothetical protein [Lympha mucosa]